MNQREQMLAVVNKLYDGVEMATPETVVDAILQSSAFQEMREKAEKWREREKLLAEKNLAHVTVSQLLDLFDQVDAFKNLRAVAHNTIVRLDQARNGQAQWERAWQKIEELRELIGNPLPAFQEMREDAEAYRTIRDNIPPCPAAQLDDCPWCKESGQGKIAEWKQKATGYDLLMDRMEVREKCRFVNEFISRLAHDEHCHMCHGTGYVVHDAKPEEVRELVERIMNNHWSNIMEIDEVGIYFITSSGGKLRRKGE